MLTNKKAEVRSLFLKNIVWGLCILILMTFSAYWPSLSNNYIWDDDYYVTNNICLRTFDGLKRIWFDIRAEPQYYPMTHSSFWLEYQIWGLNPTGYHLDNIILHALNAILLWIILINLRIPGAWVAAMLFALHPVHVESVAWITERKNVLSGFFYLFSMAIYIRFSGLHLSSLNDHKYSVKLYLISLILFICALFSKTITCSMPAVIFLLFWWKREKIGRKDILFLLPFFAVGIMFAIITAWIEKYQLGAQGIEWALSMTERFLVAGRALWFYATKLLYPSKLTFFYPRWEIDSGVWWQYLFPLAVAVVIWLLWSLRNRVGRGPLTSVLIFSGTLLPALGFFNVYPHRYSFVADHFQYLASIGLITLFSAGLLKLFHVSKPFTQKLILTILVLILGMLGVKTWKQVHIYKNQETLWTDTIEKNPLCWMAHNNLGNIRHSQGKFEAAIKHLSLAIQLNPDVAFPHFNLGNVMMEQGNMKEAFAHYQEVLRIASNKNSTLHPKEAPEVMSRTHCNIGSILERQGELDQAAFHYRSAIKAKPDFAMAHYNLAGLMARKNNLEKAIEYYQEALRIQPDFPKAHNNLGICFARTGKTEKAIYHFTEALKIRPDYLNAKNNLNTARAKLKDMNQKKVPELPKTGK